MKIKGNKYKHHLIKQTEKTILLCASTPELIFQVVTANNCEPTILEVLNSEL